MTMHATISALTEAVRDPSLAVPAGFDANRLGVYRRLVLNNLLSIFSANFPVAKRTLAGDFNDLVARFLRDHAATTPLFPELPQELIAFVLAHPDPRRPFLAELLHYEWIELKLKLLDDASHSPPPAGFLKLHPAAEPLAYHFPVERISRAFQPEAPGTQPTFLLAYRDARGRVQFHLLEVAAYLLLAQLMAQGAQTEAALVDTVLSQLGLSFEQAGAEARGTLVHFIGLGVVVAG